MSPARRGPRGVSPRHGSRRTFGHTWWGRAWVDALEHRARLDPNRLPRGRTYARTGRVGELTMGPGEVRAPVQGSRVVPYVVRVGVRVFDRSEWDRLLAAVAAKAAHTAALLDGELPPEVVADAADVGVELLPGPGELSPRCSCPDWADPCKHAAAVVYLVADVLDADPFALLLVRGRSREEVLADLRRRRAEASGRRVGGDDPPGGPLRAADPGIEARRAWGLSGARPTGGRLPPVPLPPRHPGAPAALPADPPPASGLRAGDLAQLAADAARRAWALCTGDGDGGLTLGPAMDLVRRAAGLLATPGRGPFDELAARAGYRPGELLELARAWRFGGADAVSVVAEAWPATSEGLAEGRAALASVVGTARAWRNRLTVAGAGVQLRLSRTGEWYLLARAGHGWDLVAGPDQDPAKLIGAWAAQRGTSMS